MSHITTCLWFDRQAEEAANFYVKVFTEAGRTAKIGKITRFGAAAAKVSGQPRDSVMTIDFQLDGSTFLGLNGGPMFKLSIATSFMLSCATQEEVDYFWSKLGEGGQPGQCGWIDNDKFGVTWQIVPTVLRELMSDPDPLRSERAMQAIISMTKPDIAALKKASLG